MGKSKEKKQKLAEENEKNTKKYEQEEDEEQFAAAVAAGEGKTSKKKKKREKIDVKIRTLKENPDKIAPVIGYFPSGYDPLKAHSGSEDEPDAAVKVYRNAEKSHRLQLVVSPNGSQVDFVGTSYSGEAAAPQLCTYALGVLDKETQMLRVVPIAANKIFRLEPKVRGVDLCDDEDTTKQELTAEQRADKIRDLTLAYSSKRSIRQQEKRLTLDQTKDPEVQQNLDGKLKTIKIDKEALEAASPTANARNIPPHDLDASAPQMAYPLDKIIFKGEWDYLLDVFELSQGGAEVTPDVYPRFICSRFHKLEHMEDEVERRKLAGILSYITHLIKFKDRCSMDGVSSAKNHKIPGILYQKFNSMFAGAEKGRLPDDKINLLISYVLVLTLHADNFKTDQTDIAHDLRMQPIALRPHYENLGCKFKQENKVTKAMLRVPLEFPKLRRKRSRR